MRVWEFHLTGVMLSVTHSVASLCEESSRYKHMATIRTHKAALSPHLETKTKKTVCLPMAPLLVVPFIGKLKSGEARLFVALTVTSMQSDTQSLTSDMFNSERATTTSTMLLMKSIQRFIMHHALR